MRPTEFAAADATALADLVRRREVSAAELVEHAIERIETLNPRLNAVVHTMYDRARAAVASTPVDAPFAGVPFLLKDLMADLAGEPTRGGSRAFAHNVAREDAEITRRFRKAGLVFLGKTNTPELGIVGTTEPETMGPTRNPWDPTRGSGGSSGGAAAAVAAGMVPMAHAGDGGGSIRIPAAHCGVVGLKPTRARTPMGPAHGEIWGGLDTQHAVTRSVRDTATLLDAIAGPAEGDPYHAPPLARPLKTEVGVAPGRLRIAVYRGGLFVDDVAHECRHAVDDVARLCESLGHHVEETGPALDRAQLREAYITIVAASISADVEELRRSGHPVSPTDFETLTWFFRDVGRSRSAAALELARRTASRAGREMARFFRHWDVLLCSTTGAAPPVLGTAFRPTPLEDHLLGWLRRLPLRVGIDLAIRELSARSFQPTPNTELFNLTGQPAISLPLHWDPGGLPIGVQFAGRFGDERTLIRLASQLEQVRPWADRRPELR